MAEGVDYSYSRPSPAGLVAAGKTFVVRYGAVGNTGKWLTAAEVTALKAAGLAIVTNVEETANAFRGTDAGVRHATAGDAFFRNLGMPAARPIYFSVDWDAGTADWPAVDAALRGAAGVLGAERVGVYGSYGTIAHCATAGTARWFWQTYAWSGGRWHPACHLQQYQNSVALAGGTVDLDRAMVADYGQWGGAVATSWTLVPCLVTLRAEFNAVAPTRDKASDGSVGDAAHAETSSDHNPDETGHVPIIDADTVNEVHAIDVDMTGPWPAGWTMERFVQLLLARCRAGLENRLRYIIYNARIWSASVGWAQQAYTGSNPHDQHAHFSASYDSAREADTSPWGLRAAVEDDMALTDAEITKIVTAIMARPVQTGSGDTLKNYGSVNNVLGTVAARTDYLANNIAPATKALVGDTKTLTGGVAAALSAYIDAEATDEPARAEALAKLHEAVDAIPVRLLDMLGNPTIPNEQIAASLADLFGDRAAPIGALLQSMSPPAAPGA